MQGPGHLNETSKEAIFSRQVQRMTTDRRGKTLESLTPTGSNQLSRVVGVAIDIGCGGQRTTLTQTPTFTEIGPMSQTSLLLPLGNQFSALKHQPRPVISSRQPSGRLSEGGN